MKVVCGFQGQHSINRIVNSQNMAQILRISRCFRIRWEASKNVTAENKLQFFE